MYAEFGGSSRAEYARTNTSFELSFALYASLPTFSICNEKGSPLQIGTKLRFEVESTNPKKGVLVCKAINSLSLAKEKRKEDVGAYMSGHPRRAAGQKNPKLPSCAA